LWEAGNVLSHDPDTVLGPDVSYVRSDRIPAIGIPEGFWDLAPGILPDFMCAVAELFE